MLILIDVYMTGDLFSRRFMCNGTDIQKCGKEVIFNNKILCMEINYFAILN